MTKTTLSGGYTTLVSLATATYGDPLTISATGSLGASLYAPSAWTITNLGTVNGTGANFGVTLAAGGTFDNASGGRVSAAGGINVQGAAGTVVNAGTIAGTSGTAIALAAGFVNRVVVDPGAVFSGTVDGGNTIGASGTSTLELASGASAGTFSSLGQTVLHFAYVEIDAGATWTLSGDTLASGYDVNVNGALTNLGSLDSFVRVAAGGAFTNATGALITAVSAAYGVEGTGQATITNAGRIFGGTATNTIDQSGIYLSQGGTVTNLVGGTISGYIGIYDPATALNAVTVTNTGLITGGTTQAGQYGLQLLSGGAITNSSGGTIAGYQAVFLVGGDTITNQSHGLIAGVDYGVRDGAGTAFNQGTITATGAAGYGVAFDGSGANEAVTNQAGGTIAGQNGVQMRQMAVLVNSGLISVSGIGVLDEGGNGLTNASGGTIISGTFGVTASIDGATLTNAGTISGGTDAVKLISGAANRLIVDPGASFTGTVDGGNTIGAGHTSTLELASGASAGTFSSLGSTVVHFAAITVDAGAQWTLTGDTLPSGYHINLAGTLTNSGSLGSGVSLGSGGRLTNAAGGTISASGTAVTGGSGGNTLVNAGSISGSTNAVLLAAGGTNRLIIDPGAVFTGTVDGGNTVGAVHASTLELASSGLAGTLSGLGSQFVDFAQVTVDTGATWAFTGTDTVIAGVTLTNNGTLGSTVTLGSGAQLTNSGQVSSTGIAAVYGTGAGAATVVNSGRILDSNGLGAGINLADGGSVTNLSGGTILADYAIDATSAGTITVVNDGTIGDGTYGGEAGIYLSLSGGGTITNQTAGFIYSAAYGVDVQGGLATIVNAGRISGTANAGVGHAKLVTNLSTGTITGFNGISQVQTIVNYGSISGTTGAGVTLLAHGTLLNQASGLITGVTGVAFGTVINAGTISGATTVGGVGLAGSGHYSTNLSTGTITGFTAAQVAGTLVNAGLISGSSYAVRFNPLNTGRLIVDPGATFIGAVNGENPTTSPNSSTLELASGASAGTFASLGNTVVDFINVTVDAGAAWTLTGDTLPSGYHINVAGTLTNTGSLSSGVSLGSGGRLTNAAGGTISASGTVVTGGSGGNTLVNAGSISGSTNAVLLEAGGTNRLIIDPGAVFTGTVDGGNTIGAASISTLELASAASAATLTSLGSKYIHFANIVIDAGARWTLASDSIAAGYTITDSGSLTNTGTLKSTVTLSAGAYLSNASGGKITNIGPAIRGLSGGAVSVTNAGIISGTLGTGEGISLAHGGTVSNQSGGTIAGYAALFITGAAGTLVNMGSVSGQMSGRGAAGIVLVNGGAVTNQSGGTISGYIAVGNAFGGTIAVTNAGVITGGTNGVYLDVGGTVTNQASGSISGAIGIYVKTGGVTVVNAGTISGSSDAIQFADYNNRLIVDPGAVFAGTVDGGNSIGAASISTLELASSASAGTLTGLGSQYTYFAAVMIDSGAQWTLTSDSIASGYTITDAGTLTNTGTLGSSVTLGSGAVLTNAAGGTIASTSGAAVSGSQATVVNAGLLDPMAYGVSLSGGGTVGNSTSGTIEGGTIGVVITGGAGTVVNAGTIIGGVSDAVLFSSNYGRYADRLIVDPGAVFSGTVDGGNSNSSTLELASGTAAGTLSGLGAHYVNFAQTTIDAGARWTLTGATNSLASGSSVTNLGTLTLLNTTLNDAGVIVNNGGIVIDPSSMTISSLIGTGTVTIAANSTLDVTGTVGSGETIDLVTTSGVFYLTPGTGGTSFAGQIDGFATGNTIALNGITDATSASIVGTGTLAITTTNEGTIDLRLDPSQSFAGATFNIAAQDGNDLITANDLPCFAAGTLIDTPRGPVAVQDLREGDTVRTLAGHIRPVRWVGRRHLDLTRHPDPRRAWPIRIAANAIADGAPRRDLLLSPDHALFLDGVLIAARQLCNGATIRQEPTASIVYCHVELDAHDILLAEGLAAESYLDTGNRGIFENAAHPLVLHPDFLTTNNQAHRLSHSCAPFVDAAERVEPIWQRIAQRAPLLGKALPPTVPTTEDPDLRLLCDGRILTPVRLSSRHYGFLLHGTETTVRLRSRHAPANALRHWLEDTRNLGVMVRRITLWQQGAPVNLPLDHPALRQGWWAVEGGIMSFRRWTNGDAGLVLPACGVTMLEVELCDTLAYPLAEDPPAIIRAA